MEKIHNFPQLNQLIKDKKALYGRLLSNSFLMPNEIKEYIKRQKLYVQEIKEGLLIFCDEEDYYHVYFYATLKETIEFPQISKPCIMNFTFKGDESQMLLHMKAFWCGVGFKPYKQYQRMRHDRGKKSICNLPSGYCIRKANNNDLHDIKKLWEITLDIYSTPLPDYFQLCAMIENDQIKCVVDADDKICGAAEVRITGNTCLIEHIVIDSSYRKIGLGECLLETIVKRLQKLEVVNKLLWVDIQNKAAIALYEKCGFIQDGMKSNQILL